MGVDQVARAVLGQVPVPVTSSLWESSPRYLRSSEVLVAVTHHARGLDRLMDRRPELRGVSAMADVLHDSVRWSA